MTLEFKKHARKPFLVEAIEVTEENIEEIAKLIGEIEIREDGSKFINVNPKKMPNVSRVYAGYWLTKVGKYMRCYKPRLFNERFLLVDAVNRGPINDLNGGDHTHGGDNG